MNEHIGEIILACMVLGLFGIFLAAFLAYLRFKSKDRDGLYDLLKHAQEHNQPLAPDLVRHITAGRMPSRARDFRRGVLMLAAGIGLFTTTAVILGLRWGPKGISHNAVEGVTPFIFGAFVLGLVGFAYLMLARMRSAQD
jgi:hypothetical protein